MKRSLEPDVSVSPASDDTDRWSYLCEDMQVQVRRRLSVSARFAMAMTHKTEWTVRDTTHGLGDVIDEVIEEGYTTLFAYLVTEWLPLHGKYTSQHVTMLIRALDYKQAGIIDQFSLALVNGNTTLGLGAMQQTHLSSTVPSIFFKALGSYGHVATIYRFSRWLSIGRNNTFLVKALAKADHADTLMLYGYTKKHAKKRLADDSRLIATNAGKVIDFEKLLKHAAQRTLRMVLRASPSIFKDNERLAVYKDMDDVIKHARDTIVATMTLLEYEDHDLLPVMPILESALRQGHWDLYQYMSNTFDHDANVLWTDPTILGSFLANIARYSVPVPMEDIKRALVAIDTEGDPARIHAIHLEVVNSHVSREYVRLYFDTFWHWTKTYSAWLFEELITRDCAADYAGIFLPWLLEQNNIPTIIPWHTIFSTDRLHEIISWPDNLWSSIVQGLMRGIIPAATVYYQWCMLLNPVGTWIKEFETLQGLGCPMGIHGSVVFGEGGMYGRMIDWVGDKNGPEFCRACHWIIAKGADPPSDEMLARYFLKVPVAHMTDVANLTVVSDLVKRVVWIQLLDMTTDQEDRVDRMCALHALYPDYMDAWQLHIRLDAIGCYHNKCPFPLRSLLQNLKTAGVPLSESIWCRLIKNGADTEIVSLLDTFLDAALATSELMKVAIQQILRHGRRAVFDWLRGRYPALLKERDWERWTWGELLKPIT